MHIRIFIQGGFLKIDEKAGAPGKTRLYPDLASGIHDAPSRMGGCLLYTSDAADE